MLKTGHPIFWALMLSTVLTSYAQATVITTTVAGTDNLYYDDWGHSFTNPVFDNETSALGRGNAPGAVDYAFSSGQAISISVSGYVVDSGSTATNPDGTYLNGYNEGWDFRGLPVYSLIGMWSTSASLIDPIESPFYIGSLLELIVPTAIDNLYLFLGENDGYFSDNFFDDKYNVTIAVTNVSAPSTLALMSLGIIGIAVARRQKNRSKRATPLH
ncbi:hypothetical protein MNBD_GAMMA17-1353 [hydrothermal vent metagenome]|uniref:Ice-binding protein C-terminal domain-containing protein n=1 Tax=hydrothermal vent metagenome TaxID=652676 RepID=A0A3B0Z600_9ZZZZ